MAWTPPGAGQLRHKVRFQRRGPGANDGGVVKYDWLAFGSPRRCRLLPVQGQETVQADRLAGVSAWELTLRQDSVTRNLTTDDRVLDARLARKPFAIRSVLDLEGRGRWLVLTLEAGTEDGHQQG